MFASLLGHIIGGIILFFIFIGIVMNSLGDDTPRAKAVEDNSVLHLKLDKPIVDYVPDGQVQIEQLLMNEGQSLSLNTILNNIKKAKADPRIKGIYLSHSSVMAGQASMKEIRDALADFKSEGKFIVAYSEFYTQTGYYLASVADEVYIYPEGGIEFKGYGAELTFMKEMFEKLNVEVQIIRGKNNKFKSAVEPFMLDQMSDANREQTMTYLTDLWAEVVNSVSASRDIPADKLNMIADSLMLKDATDAVDLGFANGLKYNDEMVALMHEKLGLEEGEEVNYVPIGKYTHITPWEDEDGNLVRYNDLTRPKIAVVFAQGSIVSGKGDEQTIGSDMMAKAIRDARKDSSIEAIVLRVNSPGGSALASDVIWREMVLAKAEKPVVVSMGNVAASGGYYISCAADKIYALPNTITGSIGVFGMLPNIGPMLEQEAGIHVDRVKTNAHADLGSLTRALDPDEFDMIQEGVEDVYSTFLQRVSDGRDITVADVDSIGQGRVWSGQDALDIGLVDELGGLFDASNEAAEMAGLEDYQIITYPIFEDKFEKLLEELRGDAEASISKEILGEQFGLYQEVKNIQRMINTKGVQARLPFEITIR